MSRLPTLAHACDHHRRVSDRVATTIAYVVLQDFGVKCDADLSNVIDQNKVRHEQLQDTSKSCSIYWRNCTIVLLTKIGNYTALLKIEMRQQLSSITIDTP